MLTWSEGKTAYFFRPLTAKSKDAIIATVDIRTDGIKQVRIRAVWRKSQDFTKHRSGASSYTLVNTDEKIKEYCEKRFQEWLDKAGLIQVKAL